MACFPNSSCTATLARQLIMIIHKAANPALAPSTVVAINSPEPTIEAERINPGPRNLNLSISRTGGSLMVAAEMMYGSVDIVKYTMKCRTAEPSQLHSFSTSFYLSPHENMEFWNYRPRQNRQPFCGCVSVRSPCKGYSHRLSRSQQS